MLISFSCEDCSEVYELPRSSTHCRICGGILKLHYETNRGLSDQTIHPNQTTTDEITPNISNFPSFDFFSEFLGSDLFISMQSLQNSRSTQQLSTALLKTLGKVIIDSNFLILYDMYFQIERLKVMAVPADFFPLNLLPLQCTNGQDILTNICMNTVGN